MTTKATSGVKQNIQINGAKHTETRIRKRYACCVRNHASACFVRARFYPRVYSTKFLEFKSYVLVIKHNIKKANINDIENCVICLYTKDKNV